MRKELLTGVEHVLTRLQKGLEKFDRLYHKYQVSEELARLRHYHPNLSMLGVYRWARRTTEEIVLDDLRRPIEEWGENLGRYYPRSSIRETRLRLSQR